MQPAPFPEPRAHNVLRHAWARGALHHAHLLTGDVSAARALARAFAMDCNCQHAVGLGQGHEPHACGTCATCERIAAGLHPDVQTIVGEGAAQLISMDAIRALIGRLALPAHEARLRVVLLDAGALHGAAANALLKTLEEPPPDTMFALCARAQDGVLPTLRSRCQRHVVVPGHLPIASDESDLSTQVLEVVRGRSLQSIAVFLSEHAGERGTERPTALALVERLSAVAMQRARRAIASSDVPAARAWAACGPLLDEAHNAIAHHNVAPPLALESLLVQMRAAGERYDGFPQA